MAIFRKRSVATVIAIVVVCLATLMSVHRSLGSASRKIADSFYDGVTYDGYLHKSIYSQLELRSGAAAGLAAIGANYNELETDTDTLRTARNNLAATMDGGDIAAMYKANAQLQTACDAFLTAAGNASLSSRDSDGVEQYRSTLNGAQSVIAEAGYNESVRAFQRSHLERFPASLLAPLAGIEPPVLFE